MNTIANFDRIKLKEDISVNDIDFSAGLIGTCRVILDKIVVLQYDFDYELNNQKVVGIPLEKFELATVEDIGIIDNPFKLLPKIYQKDNGFILKDGSKYAVSKIELALNEQYDSIYLKNTVSSAKDLTLLKNELDNQSTPLADNLQRFDDIEEIKNQNINVKMYEQLNSKLQINPSKKMHDEIREDDIMISINGYNFNIVEKENTIAFSQIINIEELNDYVSSINKLKKIIGGIKNG